ncbi:hypothetical protein VNO78_07551 [Psophocarpus tetragonolobus]|uniref:Growth-regulating factor n=1 Tax=Psophocarpus tetragonolobus TaxID=3891 RepID=A0AAN9XSI0_PSOTE
MLPAFQQPKDGFLQAVAIPKFIFTCCFGPMGPALFSPITCGCCQLKGWQQESGGGKMSKWPFTMSQWQELEHQALIYKYMVAGLPVPPDLVIPIQNSFHSISQNFLHHPFSTMSYCSFYGKKVDPEPGRCRRTDGKKWRCSKEAYPDSKYCERHMHRGRNRSRKPVESQTMTQSSSSTVTSLTVTTSGSSSATGNFQNLTTSNAYGNPQGTGSGTEQSHYHLDSIPYGIPSKEYRYFEGPKYEGGELSKTLGSNKVVHLESQMMPTGVASNNNFMFQQQESHSLRPFFDEWPKSRENSWSGLEDERSNHSTLNGS